MRRSLLIIFLVLPFLCWAQVVYEPVTNNPVYDLLDELAALKVITINSVVKPYSRVFIANKLNQAHQNPEKLNKRQLAEVEFYLKDYGFDLSVSGRWSLATGNDYQTQNAQPATSNQKPETSNQQPATSPASFNLNPISFRLNTNVLKMSISPQLGARFMANENGTFFEASGGGEVYGYLGNFSNKKSQKSSSQQPATSNGINIGYYVSFKHTHQSTAIVNPAMLTLEEGKTWNTLSDGSVYSNEWRGGLSMGWNWGDFGVYKDRPVWGNANHGSNIMSGHAPSFPYLQLHVKPAKWIEFYSMTGFLKSNVVDSSRSTFSEGGNDIRYRSKYFSANFFTITPWKGLDLSLGNSIFWSDQFKVGYLIPFNLYKSVDQTLKGQWAYTGYNTNDDGHLFLDISSRIIKHLNLYLGLWIDELQVARFFKTNQHNLLSWKIGFSLYDLPVKNLSLTAEYLTTRPATYDEYNPANLYANDDYSFGNYLRGDAWEIYLNLKYRPIRGLQLSVSYNLAQRGGYVYMKDDFVTYPLAQNLVFNQTTIELNGSYQLTTNVYFSLGYRFNRHSGDIRFIPEIIRGNTNTLIAGISLGL